MSANQRLDPPPLEMRQGRLESIQISDGGVPKRSISGPIEVTPNGLIGDRQRDLRFHGGPDRALCLFSRELIDELRQQGHPIDAGTTGENLTISGLDWTLMRTGLCIRIGEVEVEITKPAHPCKNIVPSFSDGDISRLSGKIHPGRTRMYARVMRPGFLHMGDSVVVIS